MDGTHVPPRLIVGIATKNRPEPLLRAIASIRDQTRQPEFVVVVGEHEDDLRGLPETITPPRGGVAIPIHGFINERTDGAAGALNSVAIHLLSLGLPPAETYVAFLDDDDTWHPSYLDRCLSKALEEEADLVISGIIRHESRESPGLLQRIPLELRVENFLVGNPHLQNSNLFVRLSTLLEAGGFDEFLPSTLDRDLWIRLLELGRTRVATIDEHLVHHWALGHERLSTPGSPRKRLGLQRFLRKYAHRMTAGQQNLFHRRAEEIFHVSLSDQPELSPPGPIEQSAPDPQSLAADLVIGLTVTYPVTATRLIEDIARIFDPRSPNSALRRIVVCDNSGDGSILDEVLQPALRAGLPVRVVSKEEIDTAASLGRLSDYYVGRERRKGIAFGRTALHTFLIEEAAPFNSPVVWILDDDVRLDDIRVGSAGRVEPQEDLTRLLCSLRELGHSVVVGGTWGDPPLPAGVLLRTQLLDLSESLRSLTAPQGTIPPSVRNDPEAVRLFPEYYYDASFRHLGHLELPFGYPVDAEERTPAGTLAEMLTRLPGILGGRDLFRPAAPAFSIPQSMDLPNRGGNTLVFDLRALAGCPNVSPRIGGVDARRGDTLWCILSNALAEPDSGRPKPAVGYFPWFVRHDRSGEGSRSLSILPVLADLYGRSFTRVVSQAIARTPSSGPEPESKILPAPAGPLDRLVQSREELWWRFVDLRDRAAIQLQLNAWRIRGLLKTIRTQLEARESWTPEACFEVDRHEQAIGTFLEAVEFAFAEDSVSVAVSSLDEGARHDFLRFFEELPQILTGYRESQLSTLEESERRSDGQLIRASFGAVAPAFLAAGREGRVYSDGDFAYKVFRRGATNLPADQFAFLLASLPREGEETRLVPILGSARTEDRLIIRMPFVGGKRYAGGHLTDLLQLVRECRQRGLVLTNLHPDNLLVDSRGIRYVDLGRSIRPFDGASFREMCKRAYLCYRWHFRPDLKEILSRSLYDESLPELTGFREFLGAIDPRPVHDLLDEKLLESLGRCCAASVMDFGCGSGGLAAKLVAEGYRVTAYDPDPQRAAQAMQRLPGIRVLDREGLAGLHASGEKFDAVVCSLVLCTIDAPEEVERVLLEARQLLAPCGHLVLVVCDPFSLGARESTLSVKLGPEIDEYRWPATVEKMVKQTGATRLDHHRPLAWYLGALHRAGFEVRDSIETEGVDIPRLAPTSDARILLARDVRPLETRSEVTLLIRTCAMEWETVGFQVRHIVSQLEGPRKFHEKIVIYDGREGPFARQYAQGDLDALVRALRELEDEGVIDRAIRIPNDPVSVQDLLLRWFGCRATDPMSDGGQPIATTVAGFDACITPLVLQMDSDCLIGRSDRSHDFLGEMLEVFERDGTALSVSMSVPLAKSTPYTAESPSGKWRTEVRFSLLHLERLRLALPLPNSTGPDGKLQLQWHRSLDLQMRRGGGGSYRGGDAPTWFVHVPNERKANVNEWYNIAKAIERGRFYYGQIGHVDLTGSLGDWLGVRNEQMVLIVRGRNVPISKVKRCLRSLATQDYDRWGVVFVDGASANGMAEYLGEVIGPAWRDRATVYLNHSSASIAENNFVAIRDLCSNPESIIVTVDADDQLIGAGTLSKVLEAYRRGADVTVGSMLRTDKAATYPVTFRDARFTRGGGNVWQHLRTFRKKLFDRIREADLKIDGDWIPEAEDWAYMLPIVEMAEHPVIVPENVYWYEPSPEKSLRSREVRETIVESIVAKSPYRSAS
jgi:SAM-dependent methyltransferase/glycosyltransferase involved in cell wall biosynthesis